VKFAVVPALATVTEAGTARAELFAERLTTEPPAGAACEIVTVQALVELETMLVGEHVSEVTCGPICPWDFAIGVFMSVCISAAESGRLYILTSSIVPLKYSPQILLPPIRSRPVEAARLPVKAWLAASAPFTYSRKTAPS